ncbi:ATP-binding protein [Streptomyces sp. NPDC007063]|uniref:ATP-binding protein n=2 Tax=unclassified Streptomyces TaxID=2593676 RepID=UPI0036D1F0D8
MSTTRPQPAGDRGPEPEGTPATAGPGCGAAGSADARVRTGTDAGREQLSAASGSGAAGTSAPEPEGGSGAMGTAAESTASAATGAARRAGQPMRQVRRLRLVGASGAVPRARDFTRRALQDWGWLPAATADQRAAAEDVLLVVSELVTNACLHADGPEELRVGANAKVLRLEIVDPGSGSPSPRTPHRAGRPGGHGMFIVQRLCLDWGVVRNSEGTGKTVWAELAAPH